MNTLGVVLAAGTGTRLSQGIKPLQRVNEKTLVEWAVEELVELGLEEDDICVVINPDHKQLFNDILRQRFVTFAYQHSPKGTFDALRTAVESRNDEFDRVIVLPADCLYTAGLATVYNEWLYRGRDYDTWWPLSYTDRPEHMTLVTLDGDNKTITRFDVKPEEPQSNLAFASVWMMTKDAYDRMCENVIVDPKGEITIEVIVAKMLEEKTLTAGGTFMPGQWLDCGYPEGLEFARKEMSYIASMRAQFVWEDFQHNMDMIVGYIREGKHQDAMIEFIETLYEIQQMPEKYFGWGKDIFQELNQLYRDSQRVATYLQHQRDMAIRNQLPLVSFDIDGVIAEPFNLTAEECERGGFRNVECNIPVIDLIEKVHREYRTQIITARRLFQSRRIVHDTRVWLYNNGVYMDKLTFAKEKGQEFVKTEMPLVHVDDNDNTAMGVASIGVPVLLVVNGDREISEEISEYSNITPTTLENLKRDLQAELAVLDTRKGVQFLESRVQ